jgi:hypothetical protein
VLKTITLGWKQMKKNVWNVIGHSKAGWIRSFVTTLAETATTTGLTVTRIVMSEVSTTH